MKIKHANLGICIMHMQYSTEKNSIYLVESKSKEVRNRNDIVIKKNDLYNENLPSSYWILWGLKENSLDDFGVLCLTYDSGRSVIKNTAIKKFLEMTKNLNGITFSKIIKK